MSDQPNKADAIVDDALELSPQQRAAYLDKACAGDPPLRELVDAMLRAHARFNAPAEVITEIKAQEPRRADYHPGDRVGHYKLLEQIGEGGCGVVYVAEQQEPVRRRVALKVIKIGMDTRQVIARFEAERQALALMDHPHIAKVLDAGATETGRPYFVMEFVRGIPVTRFCDENRINTHERLRLFIQICQAIQHAHQKGIIHRDIKPSNILVADHDGVPVPKVIDFGIAKATTDQRLTDKTLYTAIEQFIGTPAYMSPEQAKLSGLDVDTRSDIYSLGVLLYELLTSKVPFEPTALAKAGLEEMRRIIRETDPMRPSTRLSGLNEAEQTTVAKRRRLEAPKLIHIVRGDLDWIVMKCLEKDRARRYESANGLAMDIGRFLSNEPIVARPPSKMYRFLKLVRRNKVAVGAASAVSLSLVTGLGISIWLLIVARAAQRQARLEAIKSGQAFQLLGQTFEGVDPSVSRGMDTTLLTMILTNASRRFSMTLTNQPELEARLRLVLGKAFNGLGQYSNALAQTSEAVTRSRLSLGPTNELLADALANLGAMYYDLSDFRAAEKAGRDALAMRIKVLGKENRKTATSLNNLGLALWKQAKLGEAEDKALEALRIRTKILPADDPDIAQSRNNLALIQYARGDFDSTESFFREALAMQVRLRGEKNPAVGFYQNNLATVLAREGRLEEAQALHRKTLSLRQEIYHGDHDMVAYSLTQLGLITAILGDLDGARERLQEARAMQLRLGMSEQANVADTMLDLGAALMKKGDFSLAETNIAAALAMRRKVLGPMNSEVAEALDTLAVLRASGGELQEAEQLLRDALTMTRQETAPDHPDLVPVLLHLSWVLGQEHQSAEANQLHGEALAIARKRRLCGGQSLSDAICDLTDTLAARGKFTDAEPLFVELEKFCQSTEINQTLVHRHALLRGAHFYQAWDTAAPSSGQAAKAASCKQKAVDLIVPSTTGKN